jgi:hypothetical protein
MEEKHHYSEHDAVVARAFAKTIEFAQSWGPDLVKIKVTDANEKGTSNIYVQNSQGRVIEAYVNAKLSDGRQFVDCNMYSIGGNDYAEWNTSSPESFISSLDEEIKSMNSPHVDEETVEMAPGL